MKWTSNSCKSKRRARVCPNKSSKSQLLLEHCILTEVIDLTWNFGDFLYRYQARKFQFYFTNLSRSPVQRTMTMIIKPWLDILRHYQLSPIVLKMLLLILTLKLISKYCKYKFRFSQFLTVMIKQNLFTWRIFHWKIFLRRFHIHQNFCGNRRAVPEISFGLTDLVN